MRRARAFDPARLLAYLIAAFIVVPLLVVVATSFTASTFIAFPPNGFSLRWYQEVLADARFLRALGISLRIALIACAVTTVIALLAGVALERYRFRGKAALHSLFTMPLIVPMVVLAIGALFMFSSLGIARTVSALVLAHVVITLPYALRLLVTALSVLDRDIERSAVILGASDPRVFFDITLPQIVPSLIASVILTFLVSVNNAILAVFLSGTRTETLPLLMFNLTENAVSPAISAMAGLVLLITFAFLVLLERLFGLDALAGGRPQ